MYTWSLPFTCEAPGGDVRAQGTVPKEGTIVGSSVDLERYTEAVVSEPVTVTLCGKKGLCIRE